jgi:hypothetical protein
MRVETPQLPNRRFCLRHGKIVAGETNNPALRDEGRASHAAPLQSSRAVSIRHSFPAGRHMDQTSRAPRRRRWLSWRHLARAIASVALLWGPETLNADGVVIGHQDYHGSLAERSQEAVIVFHASQRPGDATEDLILKITVEGDASKFAWVVPLPNAPETKRENAAIFRELYNYVEDRKVETWNREATAQRLGKTTVKDKAAIDVISREEIGSYEVAVVRENAPGSLNAWLEANDYHTLNTGEDVIEFYRRKGYVFVCMKVNAGELAKGGPLDVHPLRFTFRTGGRDGIYFPMRMTGLQEKPFSVNLYVFYRYWISDERAPFGFKHRGFTLNYRDHDSPDCEPNGGKAYSSPATDPFLQEYAAKLGNVAAFFQKSYPGETFYLTNLQARNLNPRDVRDWVDDLWMFPYRPSEFVPYDARPGAPASAAYPQYQHVIFDEDDGLDDEYNEGVARRNRYAIAAGAASATMLALAVIAFFVVRALRPRG